MLIGFCGHIKAGKTEACLQLGDKGFYGPYSFAAELREDARKLLGPGDWVTTGKDLPCSLGITGREFLVRFGNFMRSIQPNYWVERLVQTLATAPPDTTVDDVRYPNEADLIRRGGGYLIRVVRPGFEPILLDETETVAAKLVADFEIVAVTKDELRQKVFALVDALRALEGFKHGTVQGRLQTTERVPTQTHGGVATLGQGEPGGASRASGVSDALGAGGHASDATEPLPGAEQRHPGTTLSVPNEAPQRTQQRPASTRTNERGMSKRVGVDLMKVRCGPTDITWREVQEGWGNHIPFENLATGQNTCLKCSHVWGGLTEPEEEPIVSMS